VQAFAAGRSSGVRRQAKWRKPPAGLRYQQDLKTTVLAFDTYPSPENRPATDLSKISQNKSQYADTSQLHL
jgi:hypothetical protein